MTMTTELAAAKRLLAGLPQPVLCAVSGGRDSMCLLHLLAHWGRQQGMTVMAAHFNHRLRQTAERDEEFVKSICTDWGVPLVCGGGDVRALAAETGQTLEEAGREARYAFLERTRADGGCALILTAHHAEDNAETILLNLLRGTGLQGLTGIPRQRDHICRPLLEATRQELDDYAARHGVPHVEDETNALDDAARNLLRHKVLPVLREVNPRAVENMNRTARLLAQDQRALEVETGKLLNRVAVTPGERAECSAADFRKQPKAVLSRAVLSLLVSVGGHQKDLTARHVESVLALAKGRGEKTVSLPYGMTARRRTDTIIIERTAPVPESRPITVGETVEFGSWRVTLSETPPGVRCYALRAQAGLTVTVWRSADRMTPPGGRGPRSLKRLCADAGFSPQERDALPVLRAGETPVALPGVGVNQEFAPRGDHAVWYVMFNNS